MNRRTSRIHWTVLAVFAFLGCANKITPDSLRIHFPVVKMNLDPQRMEDLYSMAVVTQLYRGLLRFNAAGDIVGDLARSWSELPDKKTYRFKLKPATFSDGSPITARNVQATFARLFHIGASMGADIDYISGTSRFKKSKKIEDLGIRTLSPDTVEFRLDRPSALFLKQLAVADCSILPIKSFARNLDPSGPFSGPYQLVHMTQNDITLQKWRNDSLDSKNPPLKVTYFLSNEAPVALARAGRTDSLDHDKVAPEEQKALEYAGWAPVPTELTGEVFVLLNPKVIPAPVRKQLYARVDQQNLASFLARKKFTPAFGLIPNGLPGELDEQSVASLKQAPEYNGPKIAIRLEYEQTSDLEGHIAEYLKGKWETPTIHVSLHGVPKQEKLQKMFGKTFQALVGRKSLDYPDGFSVIAYFKGDFESNYFLVNDPAIDRAIGESVQIFNENKRSNAYRAIQKTILSHYTIVPLLFGSEASGLWSQNVLSVPSHSLGYHTLPVESIEMRKI